MFFASILDDLPNLVDNDDPTRPLADFSLALGLSAARYRALDRFCKHPYLPRCVTAYARYRLKTIRRQCEHITILAHKRLSASADHLDDVSLALDRIRFVRSRRIHIVLDLVFRQLRPLLCDRIRKLYADLRACWDLQQGRVRPGSGRAWAQDAQRFLQCFGDGFTCDELDRLDFERCVKDLSRDPGPVRPVCRDVFTGPCPFCSGMLWDGRAVVQCNCGQAVHRKCMRAQLELNLSPFFRIPTCPKCESVWTGS